jgi:hypothetical protein
MLNNPSRIAVYSVVLLLGILGAISDLILNCWAKNQRLSWLLAAYGAWLVVATLLGILLRWGYFNFGSAVVLFVLVNCAVVLLIDYKYFLTRLSVWSCAGIVLAIAAVVCMEIGRSGQRLRGDIPTISSRTDNPDAADQATPKR